MQRSKLTRVGMIFGFTLLMLFTGCFMSKVTLIDAAAAKVDLAFVGNWDNPEQFDSTGREAGLVIRNLDGKQYYIEWDQKGESGLVRAVGFTTEVRGATFAHLRGLDPDGALEEQWLICRIDLAGSKVTIRQLSEEFFKTKTVNTPAALRQVIEQNLDNAQMYDPQTTLTATKK